MNITLRVCYRVFYSTQEHVVQGRVTKNLPEVITKDAGVLSQLKLLLHGK